MLKGWGHRQVEAALRLAGAAVGCGRWVGALAGTLRPMFIGVLLPLGLLIGPSGTCAEPAQGDDDTRRVVILNATDPYLPAFLALDSALREAIRAGRTAPTELFAEPLDMHRFPRKLLDDFVEPQASVAYRGPGQPDWQIFAGFNMQFLQ